MDFMEMLAVVDPASVVIAIQAIGAIIIVPKAVMWGIREVRGIVR